MGGLTPEDLLKGNYLAMHRNKLLAEAFYLRGDIEKFVTGFFRIKENLKEYPEALFDFETQNGFSKAVINLEKQDTQQDTPQDTQQVKKLVITLDGELKRNILQEKVGITDREYFRKEFLKPALEKGYIVMTIPDKPNSKYQKYRLTLKGKKMKEKLIQK